MATRRAAKKKVDYSQFCDELEDYSGDDDDFQDSPTLPPTKKAKSTKPSPKKKKDKKDTAGRDLTSHSSEETVMKKSSRLSVEEKVFNRDLQAALELSTNQANGQEMPSRVTLEESNSVVNNCLDELKDEKGVNSKRKKPDKDDDDYHVEDENDSSNSEDDILSDESGEEYETALTKRKKSSKKEKSSRPAKTKKTNQGMPASVKNSSNVMQKNTAAKAPNTGFTKATLKKPANSTSASPSTRDPSNQFGATIESRGVSPGLSRVTFGGGLGGVHVRQSGPSGIRLGLSRNIRVSKPLHPKASPGP